MTSGNSEAIAAWPRRQRVFGKASVLLAALFAAAWLPIAGAAQGSAFGIDALLALMGRRDSLSATFHERKFIKQLDAPVDSSGELSFEAPATMVKRTIEPRAETVRMDGKTITLERGRQQRTFSIDEHPEIAIYIEAVRAALAGDGAALARHYKIAIDGDAAGWNLQLVPKDPKLAEQLQSIVLSGVQGNVRQVEVQLTDGDYSIMNIEPRPAR